MPVPYSPGPPSLLVSSQPGRMELSSLRLISLSGLCLNFTLATILIKISRDWVSPTQAHYKASSVVVLSELTKLVTSLCLAYRESDPSLNSPFRPGDHGSNSSKEDMLNNEKAAASSGIYTSSIQERISGVLEDVFARGWIRMSIPAALFTVQTNLQFVGIANLSVPVFQCLAQLKILTTAICAVILLRKSLLSRQWSALGLLTVGVALVQLDTAGASATRVHGRHNNALLGILAVLASCLSSGFASVYFELWLKKEPTAAERINNHRSGSLWVRNIQLSLFGASIALSGFLLETFSQPPSMASSRPEGMLEHFFVGFTPLVWLIVAFQAAGGLLAALVMLYADNVLKNFATSFSILLSFVLSIWLFDYHLGFGAVAGGTLVLLSTSMYSSDLREQWVIARGMFRHTHHRPKMTPVYGEM